MIVVRDIDQLQGNESLVATLESLLVAGCCFSVDIALVAEVCVSEETSTCRCSSYNPWRRSRRRWCSGFGGICSVALCFVSLGGSEEVVDEMNIPV